MLFPMNFVDMFVATVGRDEQLVAVKALEVTATDVLDSYMICRPSPG
jgi:hypothetical protein